MTVKGTNGVAPVPMKGGRPELDDDDHAVLVLRNLIFDICNQNGGGHGGSALGMSAIGVALYKHAMRYNPSNPSWFDRDRFVLSNGHTAMFLYALNHLTGFENWTMDEIKGYGSAKTDGYSTICHAHPEIEVPGVEVTTGPLGQGISNAVGLAIASKNLAARFNKPDFDIVKSRIYCMTGDVLLYDNNQVTCDGPLDWINTEDINAKMRACGWHVLDILEGSYDVQSIVSALRMAEAHTGKPTFVNIRTIIGLGTSVAGTFRAHHGAFDKENVETSKRIAGQDPATTHQIPDRALAYFRERKAYGEMLEARWNDLVTGYSKAYPDLAAELWSAQKGDYGSEWLSILQSLDSSAFKKNATREANGFVIEKLWAVNKALCGGGADLVNSNKFSYTDDDVFHPSVSYSGRYVRYGIREHAMTAVSNGIAAYNPGTFVPLTATFLIFYLYAAPGVRMGALSHLPVIHCATHDSFAEGQNGPTHQPVEVDSLYRAMPNLQYIRPCDAEELFGAWMLALSNRYGPTMLSLARDPVGPVPATDRYKVAKGAYVVVDAPVAKLTLTSCGTNLHYAVAAAESLTSSGVSTRVVSFPSFGLFEQQDQTYQESVFPRDGTPIVSVEEYVATGWAKFVTASIGMKGYGYSASNPSNYDRFGLDEKGIESKVRKYMDRLAGRNARVVGWMQL